MSKFDEEIIKIQERYSRKVNNEKKFRENILSNEFEKDVSMNEKQRKEKGIVHSMRPLVDNPITAGLTRTKTFSVLRTITNTFTRGAIRVLDLLVSLFALLVIISIGKLYYVPYFSEETTWIGYTITIVFGVIAVFRS